MIRTLICIALVLAIIYTCVKLHSPGRAHCVKYYETHEWFDGKQGIHYSQNDQSMDSMVYIPSRNIVCMFNTRTVAHVDEQGNFSLSTGNNKFNGNINAKDDAITLTGDHKQNEPYMYECMKAAM